MARVRDIMELLGIAKKPKPKHHLEDKARKGWYEICTTRKVCAAGKRDVSAKLKFYLATKESEWMGSYHFSDYKVEITERQIDFGSTEQAESTLKRIQELVPVLQEVVAKMKAEQ